MPLAFTQEDFLVQNSFQRTNFEILHVLMDLEIICNEGGKSALRFSFLSF